MKTICRLLVALCVIAPAFAQTRPQRPQRESALLQKRQALPDFDSRRNLRASKPPGRSQALAALRSRLGSDAQIAMNEKTGGVKHAFRPDDYLSIGRAGDPRFVVNEFLTENSVFGLSAEDLKTYSDRQETDSAGVSHVYMRQELGGVRVFQTLIKAHVDSAGRVISVEGNYYPGLKAPTLRPTLSARDAVIKAMQSSLPDLLQKVSAKQTPRIPPGSASVRLISSARARQFPQILSRSSGPDQKTVFGRTVLKDNIEAKLVIFPWPGGSAYGWQVYLHAADRKAAYSVVIDARTGALLHRSNSYRYAQDSTASIFPKDPNSTPLTVLPYFGPTVLSPNRWSNGPATIGNNVQGTPPPVPAILFTPSPMHGGHPAPTPLTSRTREYDSLRLTPWRPATR